MKKAIIGAMLFALAMTPVLADGHITTSAEIWNRYENLSNFTDFTDTSGSGVDDDDFDFGTYRVRAGIGVEFDEDIDGMIEFTTYGNWGGTLFPSNAQDPLLGGSLDLTGASSSGVELYQAYVNLANIGDSNFSLKFGRQEHVLGNELHIGDNDFYGGQYFDGLRGMFDFETWELNLFYYLVAERNLLPGALVNGGDVGGSDDATFWGAHASFDINDSNSIEPYILVNKDGNEAGFKRVSHTIGALYNFDSDDSQFDGSFEYAMQSGEFGNSGQTDLSAFVAEGAFGYDFSDDADATNRIGLGITIWGDGDDANDVEAFQELYTDSHRRLGLLDLFSSGLTASGVGLDSLHNIQDINLNWMWNNGTHGFGAAYHMFTAFEDFGGEDEIGSEIDLLYNFTHGEHFGVEAGVAMFDPGDAFANDDSVMRIYAMGKVRK